jgi:hypothetical protein
LPMMTSSPACTASINADRLALASEMFFKITIQEYQTRSDQTWSGRQGLALRSARHPLCHNQR